jgi:hypothetical protein
MNNFLSPCPPSLLITVVQGEGTSTGASVGPFASSTEYGHPVNPAFDISVVDPVRQGEGVGVSVAAFNKCRRIPWEYFRITSIIWW